MTQVESDLKAKLVYAPDADLRKVRDSQYREIPSDTLGLNNGERVAVIYASGAINIGGSSNGPLGGEMVGSDTVVNAINDAAKDRTVKAIVLRVDSPGGSALASDLMWHAIENAKAKKPFVVSMSDVAASGGYYIACNANKIVAEPSTVTGSIGMFMGKPVIKGLYDWLGVSNEFILRGKNAGIFRETEKFTDGERAKMTEQANNVYYENFVPKVAMGRKMTNEQVNTLGQGRVWTGTQAKANGLIDEFGGLEKAISIAKDLANLPADPMLTRFLRAGQKGNFSRGSVIRLAIQYGRIFIELFTERPYRAGYTKNHERKQPLRQPQVLPLGMAAPGRCRRLLALFCRHQPPQPRHGSFSS